MASVPVDVLLGVYLGLLTGIIPAIVSWVLGFGFKYLTGVTLPGFGVVVLALAIAGVNGGLLALTDPTVRQSSTSITLTAAILIVLMMSLYAHAKGDQLGATFPKHLSLRTLRERTLSADVVERVGGRGQVRITVAGEVEDVEGYPPLQPELRAEISDGEWTFPSDLPLIELETRLADTLTTEFDLSVVDVRLDERGKATIAAAPPTSGVSKRVPRGQRAISIHALVPTGLARGDEVSVILEDEIIGGTVVSAQSSVHTDTNTGVETDGGTPEEPPVVAPRAPVTDGGDGRITIAVNQADATRLLAFDRVHVVVQSRGIRREFELLSLLRQAGKRFRRLTIGVNTHIAGETLGDVRLRENHDVVVLAIQTEEGWDIAPHGETVLKAGVDLIVIGTRDRLDRFAVEVT